MEYFLSTILHSKWSKCKLVNYVVFKVYQFSWFFYYKNDKIDQIIWNVSQIHLQVKMYHFESREKYIKNVPILKFRKNVGTI